MIGTITSEQQRQRAVLAQAMITPPTAISGAVTITVSAISTSICTCWTSLVLRVISDGAPNVFISRSENLCTARNMRRAHVAADRHRRPRGEVERDDRRRAATRNDDQQHQAADAHDVAGVARGHAVVDDVGVELGQVQGADDLQDQQADDDREVAAVGRQVGAEKGDHRGDPTPGPGARARDLCPIGSGPLRRARIPSGPDERDRLNPDAIRRRAARRVVPARSGVGPCPRDRGPDELGGRPRDDPASRRGASSHVAGWVSAYRAIPISEAISGFARASDPMTDRQRRPGHVPHLQRMPRAPLEERDDVHPASAPRARRTRRCRADQSTTARCATRSATSSMAT